MIIGLSGTFASGKDTLARYLVQTYNFMHISTGDMVRAVAEAEYGNTERPTLRKTANELRSKRGPGVFAELALERYEEEKNDYTGLIISGVRSLGEVNMIQRKGGIIVFVDAPVELRYGRIKDRHRANEELLSFEEFKASEEAESHHEHNNPAIQDIPGVRDLADLVVFNTNDIDAFFRDAEQKLGLSI